LVEDFVSKEDGGTEHHVFAHLYVWTDRVKN